MVGLLLRVEVLQGIGAPDDWIAAATRHEGSWWPAWQAWLVAHSGSAARPPAFGAPARGYPVLEDAPGAYVRQR
jgi:polyhydroxyalkanoate synthase